MAKCYIIMLCCLFLVRCLPALIFSIKKMKENTHRNRHQQQLVAQQAGRQGGGTARELGVQGICLVCLFFELKVNVAHIKVQICFICQHKLYEK